jgi:hypothetical protein|tara:strand:- start:198 stop:698 length:501 start_codon:yes stop_codon:yes gene_type:complete
MYKKKQLFRNTNANFEKEASAIESTWAYIYGTETKVTGRYRIRITKMSAGELIAMGLAPAETPEDFYGLQANLDKWQELHGWLPVLDWVGDPMASIEKIERELGKQFQSFITGIGIEEDFSFELPKPPKKNTFKIPDPKKDAEPSIVPTEAESAPTATSDDDFDWL